MLTPPTLEQIALIDPVAAYFIAKSGRRIPQLFPIAVTFSDNSAPQEQDIPNCGSDLFVCGLDYDVERPNFGSGTFKAESDFYNAKSPYVDLRIKINRRCESFIFGDDARIQTVARHATSTGDGLEYMRSFTLFAFDSAQCVFTLKRALEQGEDPYRVLLVLKGYILPCRGYDGGAGIVTPEQAIVFLRDKYGVDVTKTYKP